MSVATVVSFLFSVYRNNRRILQFANTITTNMAGTVENLPISTWLSDLHMECYKKNLEDYDTIRVSLPFKRQYIRVFVIVCSKYLSY